MPSLCKAWWAEKGAHEANFVLELESLAKLNTAQEREEIRESCKSNRKITSQSRISVLPYSADPSGRAFLHSKAIISFQPMLGEKELVWIESGLPARIS